MELASILFIFCFGRGFQYLFLVFVPVRESLAVKSLVTKQKQINAVGTVKYSQSAKQTFLRRELGGEALISLNSVPWCFNRAVYDQGFHDAKMKLGSGGIRTHASRSDWCLKPAP